MWSSEKKANLLFYRGKGKVKTPCMQRSSENLPYTLIRKKYWEPRLRRNESSLQKLKEEALEAFEKERTGQNLFSMKNLLPVLLATGVAMETYAKILPNLVKALLKTEGVVSALSQKETRKMQAKDILQELWEYSHRSTADPEQEIKKANFRKSVRAAFADEKQNVDEWLPLAIVP